MPMSPFTKGIKELMIPQLDEMRDYPKYYGDADPEEYLPNFDIEMSLLRVEKLARCRMLEATVSCSTKHQWFKHLQTESIKSWEQMKELFVAQYQTPRWFTLFVVSLEKYRQRREETLGSYYHRFARKEARIRRTLDVVLRTLLLKGVRSGTDPSEEFLRSRVREFSRPYTQSEPHKIKEWRKETSLKRDRGGRRLRLREITSASSLLGIPTWASFKFLWTHQVFVPIAFKLHVKGHQLS
ncbi:hypothetical protein POM88_010018 [Heracleum sosnowskyi]|uniref:Retrotransposon gag domain-containing protein n=1 Tax=Heracleum sosnowskyi TaxID=360622 RepID=A0AAD8N3B6_9APIA|nr:hypothetical protein POM88_010018 [Heracleum sosnowskyi]